MPKAASKSSGPQPASRSAPYPPPKPKASETSTLTEKSATSLNAAAAKQPPSSSSPSSEPTASSFLDLELSGEENHQVPIYDTCTIIRTKCNNLINAKNPKPENAIPHETLKNGEPKYWNVKAFVEVLGDGVSEKMYRTFMKKSGTMTGAESEVFYRAHCFFEKKRVWEGKAKSGARRRAEVEHIHGIKLWDPKKPHYIKAVRGAKIPGPRDPESCGMCGRH